MSHGERRLFESLLQKEGLVWRECLSTMRSKLFEGFLLRDYLSSVFYGDRGEETTIQ